MRLEILPVNFIRLLELLSGIAGLAGIVLLVNLVTGFIGQAPWGGLGIASGFGLLFLARLLSGIASILKRLSIIFIFDLRERVIRIEGRTDYPHIPRQIPFSEVRVVRLMTRAQPRNQKTAPQYFLELRLRNDKFYPVTTFYSREKARRISQEMARALDVPFEEAAVPHEDSFREYKARFLAQFQPDAAQVSDSST